MATKEYARYWSPEAPSYIGYHISSKLPTWAFAYSHVTLHIHQIPSRDPYVLAFNETERSQERNILYGYLRFLNAKNGYKSYFRDGKWTSPEYFESATIWCDSPYASNSHQTVWTNADIYGWGTRDNPNAPDFLALSASEPKILVIETGWGYFDKGDEVQDGDGYVILGRSVLGGISCVVKESSDDSFTFEWYEDGALASTQRIGSRSWYKPKNIEDLGRHSCYCKVTSSSGMELTSDRIYWNVVEYGDDSGSGGAGGSGGGSPDYGTGFWIDPMVTDIVTTVNPDTVAPGGHSLVSVTVNGCGKYNKAFTAEISKHTSSTTKIVKGANSCNVWIGEDETAEYVLVTVASVQDPEITSTEMVYIDYSGTEEETTTAEQMQLAFWKGYATAKAYFQQVGLDVSAINVDAEEEPTSTPGKVKREFWKGFVSGVTAGEALQPEIIASFADGVLHIEKAPATLTDGVLKIGG